MNDTPEIPEDIDEMTKAELEALPAGVLRAYLDLPRNRDEVRLLSTTWYPTDEPYEYVDDTYAPRVEDLLSFTWRETGAFVHHQSLY